MPSKTLDKICMKKLIIIVALSMMSMGHLAKAHDTTKVEPKGKAIIQVFANAHTGFGADNDDRGFELDRSYVGYQYSLTKELQIKAVLDVGMSNDVDDYHHIAYVKNAQVTWKPGRLTLEGGMISTTQFKVQEKHWGYRYIMKSFQDEYKFGSSADLGISAAYKFADWVSADAIIVNGEGYKRVQVNDGLQYGLGATFMPVEGLTLRLYGSINESSIDQIKDAYNWAAFAGYKHKYFSLGAEYNIYQNAKFEMDHDLYGLSVYGTAHVSKVVDIFARYDNLSSNNDWNILKDESAAMLGAQIKLGKYVKIAPNVRMSIPSAPGADNHYSAYVSCYFGI